MLCHSISPLHGNNGHLETEDEVAAGHLTLLSDCWANKKALVSFQVLKILNRD